jgi:hypothetical protein
MSSKLEYGYCKRSLCAHYFDVFKPSATCPGHCHANIYGVLYCWIVIVSKCVTFQYLKVIQFLASSRLVFVSSNQAPNYDVIKYLLANKTVELRLRRYCIRRGAYKAIAFWCFHFTSSLATVINVIIDNIFLSVTFLPRCFDFCFN